MGLDAALKRKVWWPVLVAALLAACSAKQGEAPEGPAPASAPNVEWKLVTTWPKNLPALGTAPEKLAQLVAAMSAGRFQIKVYAAGELVPALEVFDAVSQGNAEMGHGAAYYWRGKVPMAAFFTTVPFGMDRAGDERLAALRRRLGTVARAVRPVRLGAPAGRQFRRANGRLVQQGDQLAGGPARPQDAHSRPRRRGVRARPAAPP